MKAIITLIILLLVGFGIYKLWGNRNNTDDTGYTNANGAASVESGAQNPSDDSTDLNQYEDKG
ncbi:hypothetical protein KW807_00375 [Candidatus Parcubacteria bacterium]|nr:hypothetical protein [Candidatus Parcubacteria bacterium]